MALIDTRRHFDCFYYYYYRFVALAQFVCGLVFGAAERRRSTVSGQWSVVGKQAG